MMKRFEEHDGMSAQARLACGAGAMLAALVVVPLAVMANEQERQRHPAPAIEVPHPRPPLLGRPPSPGNSEAGSPVRDYLYRPPADSGSITDRLVPPSTVRSAPRL